MVIPPLLTVALLGILPISELRGAIFYGIVSTDLPLVTVYIVAVGANLLIAPVVFFFLNYVHHFFMRVSLYNRLFTRFIERTRRKTHKHIEKYGYFGLTVFVAVPLPMTGAYTGTAAAWVFGLDQKKSIAAVSLGVVVAGIIVAFASLAGDGIWQLFVAPLFS